MILNKTKYRVVYVRKEYELLRVVKTRTSTKIDFLTKENEGTFFIDIEKPTFIQDNLKVYFMNIDTNSQLLFSEVKALLNPKELDLMVSNKLLKDLTSGAMDNFKDKLINLIIGGLIGAMISALICISYMNSKIEEIYGTAMQFTNFVVG